MDDVAPRSRADYPDQPLTSALRADSAPVPPLTESAPGVKRTRMLVAGQGPGGQQGQPPTGG